MNRHKKILMNKWTGGTLLAGMSLVGLPAFAQEVESLNSGAAAPATGEEQPATEAGGRLPITTTAGLAEQFSSKIDGTSASFSITRFSAGVMAPVRLNDQFSLGNSFRYGLDSYNFNSFSGNFPRQPWHNINTVSLASVLKWRMDDTWTFYGGGFMKMSADSAAELEEGTTGGGLGGFDYKVNDTLSLGAGLAISTQLAEHKLFLPLLTAKWKFADDWMLTAGLTDVATMGYGVEADWHFNDAWDFGFGAQYHKSRFTISNHNIPSSQDGVGQEEAMTIYASATWHADPKVDVTGFVGMTAGGNIDAMTSSGNSIGVYNHNYKPTALLGAKASVRF